MPTKQEQLTALADAVRRFIDQEIPAAATWNINPDLLDQLARLVGTFFTDTDDALAALRTLFEADHNAATGENPAPIEWIPESAPPTFLGANQFSLDGDRTADYQVGDRIRIHQGGGGVLLVVAIIGVTFAIGKTTVTVRTAANEFPLTNPTASIDRALAKHSLRRMGRFDFVDGAVDEARILVDGVVTGPKLAAGSVDREKILDGEIVAGKLGPDAVGPDNLTEEAVLGTHLALRTITGDRIANHTLGSQQIALRGIAGESLDYEAVDNLRMATGAVDERVLADSNVTGDKIAPDAVGTLHLGDGVVTPQKVAAMAYQANTTNGTKAAVSRQCGWGFIAADAGVVAEGVTFPVPFANELLGFNVTILGIKNGADPTSPADTDPLLTPTGNGSNAVNNTPIASVQGGSWSRTGVTVRIAQNSTAAVWPATWRIVYGWEATGR